MREKFLAVIIPVYNAAKFLPDAIESVLCQECKKLSVIIVDDGSTDTSLSIANEYATKFCNVFVLHQNNKGVSSARNAGIEYAINGGEYIALSWMPMMFG